MRCHWQQWTGIFALVCAQTLVSAATSVFEPEADLRLLGLSGLQNQNESAGILSVYTAADNVQRTLIRFSSSDLASLQGQPVTSAVLSLVASTLYGGSTGRATEVYRATASWDEKTATWLSRETGVAWSVPGGDYVGQTGLPDVAPYASNSNSPANGDTISWEITDLVNAWIAGTVPNDGLLLRSYQGNGLTFGQREASPALGPKLTITTGLPPLSVAPPDGSGQVTISWAGQNVGLLEENSAMASVGWTPSGPAVFANGRSQVTVPALDAAKFFRLRSP